MTNYRIHIAYVISNKEENKHCYERLRYNLKDYNIEFNSNYINFKRVDIITNRSINFDVEYANLFDVIQKIWIHTKCDWYGIRITIRNIYYQWI